MADIFICYSRSDTEKVTHLVRRLEAAGYSVWMDVTNVDGASVWAQEIVDAIDTCAVVTLMLTKHSADSHHVVKELSLATDKNKRILPLKLDSTKIPASMQYHLASLQFLELHAHEEDEAFEMISRALARHNVTPTEEPKPLPEKPTAPAGPSKAKQAFAAAGAYVRKIGPAVSGALAKAKPLAVKATNTRNRKLITTGVGLVMLGLVLWAIFAGEPDTVPVLSSTDAPGLTDETLQMAVQSVTTHTRLKGLIVSSNKPVFGTAAVVQSDGKRLILLTNSAALGLRNIIATQEIEEFQIEITFVSGQKRIATGFVDNLNDQDLALIEIQGEGLTPGKDYAVLPYESKVKVAVDDTVVMLKRSDVPNSVRPVQSEALVTGIMERGKHPNISRVYHTDAALTSANRGALLFKRDGSKLYWVAINVYDTRDTREQDLSVAASTLTDADGHWFPATPYGADRARKQLYSLEARMDD